MQLVQIFSQLYLQLSYDYKLMLKIIIKHNKRETTFKSYFTCIRWRRARFHADKHLLTFDATKK